MPPNSGDRAVMADKKVAIVLLSGGIDSATTLAIAKEQGHAVYALSFDYGQRHKVELAAARRIAQDVGAIEHRVLKLDNSIFAGSALTDDLAVPKSRSATEMALGIPLTYVPGRNTIFLSHAMAWAEVLGGHDVFIGVNAIDYSGYPDCRPEFISAFEQMARLATKAGVEGCDFKVHTPVIALTKAQIINRAVALGIDLSLTHSCYDPLPDARACGRCDSCQLRLKGFREAGVTDPVPYAV
jgi:7-cyano-7-deazaguanine synthase